MKGAPVVLAPSGSGRVASNPADRAALRARSSPKEKEADLAVPEKENDPKSRPARLERWYDDVFATPEKRYPTMSTPSTGSTAPSSGERAQDVPSARGTTAVSPVAMRSSLTTDRDDGQAGNPVKALYAVHSEARRRGLESGATANASPGRFGVAAPNPAPPEPAGPHAAPAAPKPAEASAGAFRPPARTGSVGPDPAFASARPRLMVRPTEAAGRNAGQGPAVAEQGLAAEGVTQVALGTAGVWDWSCKLQPLDLRRFPTEPSQVHQALRQSLRFLASTEIPKPGQYLPVSGARVLLPAELPQHRGRMTLVLDLDETLIHCVKSPTEDRLAAEGTPPDLCIRFSDGAVKGSIRFRPYTKVFLEVVSNLFEVVVFTASTQAYADTVLDTLDPNKKWITHRLYRPSCTLSPSGGYFKDLSLLGRPLDKVILVDNSPTSLAMQPDNGIPVRTWQDDMKDREMIDLISVLHSCRSAPNVRSFLKQAYRFEEFLEKLRYQDAETAALLQRYGEL